MKCETLFLNEFIKYVCSAEKPEGFEELISEYGELKGDSRSKSLLLLYKEIEVLEQDLIIIQKIVDQFSIKFDERLGQMLRDDCEYWFEYENNDALPQQLVTTIAIARNKLVEKNELLSTLKEINEGEASEPLTELDFMVQIQSYAKWQGFAIPLETTTVTQYIAIQKLYKLHEK